MSRCKSCGAEITFVRSMATGTPMPLDAEPNPEGNVVLVREDGEVRAVITQEPDKRPLYMPHHVTCPHAEAWRRKKEGSRG